MPDRRCLTGILLVLKTGIAWEDFPKEMGCCGMTLWNRLDEWRRAGVWPRLHQLLLDQFRGAHVIDISRVIVDSSSTRAVPGKKGKSPVDRRRNGSKHHLAVDAGGIPLACLLTRANRHDVTQLIPLIDAIPPVRGTTGAPLRKSKEVMADGGYDTDPRRMVLAVREHCHGPSPAEHAPRQRAGDLPLFGRADDRPAPPVPVTEDPL